MAIAVDASTPVRWTGNPENNVDLTSASFTAPSGALLVVCVSADSTSALTFAASDSGGLTWTSQAARVSATGHAEILTALTSSQVARTVSVRRTAGNGGTNQISVKCYVVTGIDTNDPIGATNDGTSTTNNLTVSAYTSTADNSRGFGVGFDYDHAGTATSTDVEDAYAIAGAGDAISLYKATDTTPSGTAVTMNFDAAGTEGALWMWAAVEIKPASSTVSSGDGNITTSASATSAGLLALVGDAATVATAVASGEGVVIVVGDAIATATAEAASVGVAVVAGDAVTSATAEAASAGLLLAIADAASIAVGALAGDGTSISVQVARPTADVSDGTWTDQDGGTQLYAAISEATPSDVNYIRSAQSPAVADVVKIRFGTLSDPDSAVGHYVRYRYGKDADGDDQINLTVRLYAADGVTEIASWTHTDVQVTLTTAEQPLNEAQANSIPPGDYGTGLVLAFEAVKAP